MNGRTLRVCVTLVTLGCLVLAPRASAAMAFVATAVDADKIDQARNPETDGAWVVWDRRASLPGTSWGVMALNLRTGENVMILTGDSAIDSKDQILPDVSMERVVFEHHEALGNRDVGLYDLRTGETTWLARTAHDEYGPRISGDLVIWRDETDKALKYVHLRNPGLSGAIAYGDDTIRAWDVDRGRIAYVLDNGTHDVCVLRPGIDASPLEIFDGGAQIELAWWSSISIHGDKVAGARGFPERALSVLDVLSGVEEIEHAPSDPYGYYSASVFHGTTASECNVPAVSAYDIHWQDLPDPVVTVAGTTADEQDPALFGRRVVWEQDTYAGDVYMASAAPEAVRTSGDDRYETAAAVSAAYFSAAENAVLCTGLNFPDALAAAPFAKMMDAPLLLTQTATLPLATIVELQRLGVTHVYIVGGEAAVALEIEDALEQLSMTSERIEGNNRYETANAIATRIVDAAESSGGYSGTAFFARGDAFPDALAVGPVAAQANAPIFLVQASALPGSVAGALTALDVTTGYVIGGESAVSAAVQDSIDARLTANGGSASPTGRWSGDDRYQTALDVVEGGLEMRWIDLDTLGVATGANFPDALGGGAALGYYGSGLVLTPTGSMNADVISFLTNHEYEIGRLDVFGGTAAVSDVVKTGFATRLM